ncbi:hypothetical protein HCH_00531 [Hahella chejuensis KCTC 2396]|uniref:Uncharacterized protein n=1 Tax=Hahella chejuensis (strain KCTC 2396) TaxID=349521 RepID=Q2SPI9_HAHCH|nr:hypothetical protein HCH_00531 [Hahella chejuensis KCTC 2396]
MLQRLHCCGKIAANSYRHTWMIVILAANNN